MGERDDNGRFVKGHKGGPGRAKGSRNHSTQAYRDALEASFNKLGAAEYLEELATIHPPSYAALIGKMLASEIKVQLESEDGLPLVVIRDYTGRNRGGE
jgi:hypothetical protein